MHAVKCIADFPFAKENRYTKSFEALPIKTAQRTQNIKKINKNNTQIPHVSFRLITYLYTTYITITNHSKYIS